VREWKMVSEKHVSFLRQVAEGNVWAQARGWRKLCNGALNNSFPSNMVRRFGLARYVALMQDVNFWSENVKKRGLLEVTELYGRILLNTIIYGGPLMVAQWLRYCATNRKVAGSIPGGVIGIFHWHNPSDRTMALGSIQPLTKVSTRSISWG
jgi:hypothetical protein